MFPQFQDTVFLSWLYIIQLKKSEFHLLPHSCRMDMSYRLKIFVYIDLLPPLLVSNILEMDNGRTTQTEIRDSGTLVPHNYMGYL